MHIHTATVTMTTTLTTQSDKIAREPNTRRQLEPPPSPVSSTLPRINAKDKLGKVNSKTDTEDKLGRAADNVDEKRLILERARVSFPDEAVGLGVGCGDLDEHRITVGMNRGTDGPHNVRRRMSIEVCVCVYFVVHGAGCTVLRLRFAHAG